MLGQLLLCDSRIAASKRRRSLPVCTAEEPSLSRNAPPGIFAEIHTGHHWRRVLDFLKPAQLEVAARRQLRTAIVAVENIRAAKERKDRRRGSRAFKRGDAVEYRDYKSEWVPALINIAHNAGVVTPHFTIVLGCGRERRAEAERLRWPSIKPSGGWRAFEALAAKCHKCRSLYHTIRWQTRGLRHLRQSLWWGRSDLRADLGNQTLERGALTTSPSALAAVRTALDAGIDVLRGVAVKVAHIDLISKTLFKELKPFYVSHISDWLRITIKACKDQFVI